MSELPYLTPDGELRIPHNAPQRYKWWAGGGQSIWQTLTEIEAPLKAWKLYAYRSMDLLMDGHGKRCGGEVKQSADCVHCAHCGQFAEMAAMKREHVWYKCVQPCNNQYCQFCEGGLGWCTVCDGFEGTLTSECPGRVITEEEARKIYEEKTLDFTAGEWVTLMPEVQR